MPDADRLMQDLHHRREAVRGAGSGGDDPVPRGIVAVIIDAVDDIGGLRVLHRGGDDHFPDACREIGFQRRRALEGAGAVDDHIHPLQGQRGKVPCADEGQARAVDGHAVGVVGKPGPPAAMDAVEFQQMRLHRRIAHDVIDPGNPRPPLQQRLQRKLAHPAKTVQRVDGHALSPAPVCAIASTAFCSEIRSSEAIGSAAKALIRFCSAP